MTKEKVIAVYDNHDEAAEAMKAMLAAGVLKEDISVVGKGERGEPKDDFELDKENADILTWGKEGALWGGIWGFLAGAFFLWVPGFGPLVAAGPVIASLAGALGGAATVGGIAAIIAGFIDIGIDESEARRYADLIKNGKTVIIVRNAISAEKAKDVLENLGKGEVKFYQKA
ncbi:hypothetical protein MNB_SV-10-69 [hydrothermal vent metagenome]|uniref:Uncharacterized protein n=1 Tax=hydrothermal vent metagenome TaxID=652676 RepID=A0A1W1C349_9ZZZZ